MRGILVTRSRRLIGCALVCAGAGGSIGSSRAQESPPPAVITNIQQLRAFGSQNPRTSYFIRLEGVVWWANADQDRLVLRDDTGAAQLEVELQNHTVRLGQRIRLEGNGTIARRGAGFRIGVKGPVVDNNGVHPMIEKSGAVHLKAGLHPIRVNWFNGVDRSGLEVDYEGPGLPRQRIPNSALFRMPADLESGTSNLVNGLNYRCYEDSGEVLPDFDRLVPIKTGTTGGFDPGAASRDQHVALQFTGFLNTPRDGLYTFYTRSDDGSQLFIDEPSVQLALLGEGELPAPRRIAIGQPLPEGDDCQWAEVEGTVTFVSEQGGGVELELLSGTGRLRVEIADGSVMPAGVWLNRRVRATGVCQGTYTADGEKVAAVLLVADGKSIQRAEAPLEHESLAGSNPAALPVLTTAVEVHRLKREEAQRGYTVKFRGVITCVLPEHQGFVIQDSTRGLYVEDFSASRSGLPQIGEFLEVEGTTDPGKFAPIVNARRVIDLGEGHLPDPVRPNWDQLMNGSLDAQYVELEGVPTAIHSNGVALLTRDGRIHLELRVNGTDSLAGYEDALVRIRGCLLASWDYVTHEVTAGSIRVYGADIAVDQPAPADLFSTPAKSVAALRQFDPQASVFQRVKVSGQIVHAGEGEYFLMQGNHGARFITKKPMAFETGDTVDVVGFPELFGNAAPVLREAVARRTGRVPLPEPRRLERDDLLRADRDATRVQVEGQLVNIRQTGRGLVLELQSGVRNYVARLNTRDDSLQSLPIGSRLELTGVYAAHGGNRTIGQDIASFDLLLSSIADLKVLARPPWWTLERLLVIVGALACVLVVTVLWITQLHRKVEARTTELEKQIRERQRVEHQREMEQERARIAQDLHDELGSGVTEIGMLVARARTAPNQEEKRSRYLEQMGGKAREMVTALDEIVWAMNPKHDSLASLVSYFCLYAERFLGLANIAWRLENSAALPDRVVNSRHRHQLFLAFKEALTNVVRHSGASEVRLKIELQAGQVRLSISDNGRGLPVGEPTGEMDGVANMRARVEKLGGRFEIASEPGRGTVLRFCVPSS
jgi:signal transduction histidine kinase